MMDWTDRHCRAFHRLLTRHALLYTEMVTAPAILHGDRARLLGMSEIEHPVALQLGGSDPGALAEAAAIGESFGYDEINLNVGCPSDRVQEGRFGACLMAEPELVAACVAAMQRQRHACRSPSSAASASTSRMPRRDLQRFIDVVAGAGCRTFIVHARKAWLAGAVAEAEPRGAAARLCARLPAQGGAARADHRPQRRHRRPRRGRARISSTSTA